MARPRSRSARPPRNQVRIIAGQWRGRRIEFPEHAGLRPTPDRVRETVFNWLAPWLPGARCLDLFAGSGVFGLESLSRGAGHVVLVEQAPAALEMLRTSCDRLGAGSAVEIVGDDALHYLAGPTESFDVIFLDPPYSQNLLMPCLTRLVERGWIRPGGWLYIEAAAREPLALPPGLELRRSKTAGQVGYHLAQYRDDKDKT